MPEQDFDRFGNVATTHGTDEDADSAARAESRREWELEAADLADELGAFARRLQEIGKAEEPERWDGLS